MRFGILALISALTATAQPSVPVSPFDAQEQNSVALLFQSSRPEDLAWGAYLAANYQQRAFVPQIIDLLKSENSRVQGAALDSLIRLKAEVPEPALTSLIETFPNQTLVLLSFDWNKHTDLVKSLLDRPWLAQEKFDEDWVALNDLLAESRAPGYAARLLREWTLHLHFDVLESRSGRVTIVGRSSFLCVDRTAMSGRGFPPTQYYPFRDLLRPGWTWLEGGVHPILYRATADVPQCFLRISRDEYRLDYIFALEGNRQARGLAAAPPHYVEFVWTNEGAFRSDAEALMSEVRTFVNDARNRLIAQKVLDAGDPAQPKIEVTVTDLRKTKSAPLPVIDWHL